ncbi:MFS transporter [SAR202 cluster bacterium AD-804-J14_MRT_500m]|nr:MFS transporter [SAR202 cluster bacterium AD-804-J14_MRT_500m]
MTNAPAIPILNRHANVIVLCLAIVLNMIGQGVVSPSIPLFAKEFTTAPTLIGLAVVMIATGRMIMSLPGGVLVQTLGRKPVLVIGMAAMGIGAIMSPFATNINYLIIFRLISGLGTGAFVLGSMVYLRDASSPRSRARYQSLNELSILFGISIGAITGGFLAEAWGLKSTFFIQAIVSFAAVPILILFLPETKNRTRLLPPSAVSGRTDYDRSEKAVLRRLIFSPGFLAVALLSLWIVTNRQGARFFVMPLLAGAKGFGPTDIGLFFFCTHIPQFFAVLVSGLVTDRFGRKIALLPAAALIGIGIVTFINSDSLWMLLLSATLLGMGEGLATPPTATYFADVSPRGLEGVTMGIYGTFGGCGALIGATALGFISDLYSFELALWVDALVFICLVLLVIALVRSTVPKNFSAQSKPLSA